VKFPRLDLLFANFSNIIKISFSFNEVNFFACKRSYIAKMEKYRLDEATIFRTRRRAKLEWKLEKWDCFWLLILHIRYWITIVGLSSNVINSRRVAMNFQSLFLQSVTFSITSQTYVWTHFSTIIMKKVKFCTFLKLNKKIELSSFKDVYGEKGVLKMLSIWLQLTLIRRRFVIKRTHTYVRR
jgi:hypothetical protein